MKRFHASINVDLSLNLLLEYLLKNVQHYQRIAAVVVVNIVTFAAMLQMKSLAVSAIWNAKVDQKSKA